MKTSKDNNTVIFVILQILLTRLVSPWAPDGHHRSVFVSTYVQDVVYCWEIDVFLPFNAMLHVSGVYYRKEAKYYIGPDVHVVFFPVKGWIGIKWTNSSIKSCRLDFNPVLIQNPAHRIYWIKTIS